MELKKVRQDTNLDNFFGELEVGEIFSYSQIFSLNEIRFLAKSHGVTIEYCAPNFKEYGEYGCFTCKVIDKEGFYISKVIAATG